MKFEDFKNMLLYHKIVKWVDNKIVLDNGIEIRIETTEKRMMKYIFLVICSGAMTERKESYLNSKAASI